MQNKFKLDLNCLDLNPSSPQEGLIYYFNLLNPKMCSPSLSPAVNRRAVQLHALTAPFGQVLPKACCALQTPQ